MTSVLTHKESSVSPLNGTIIDIETVGAFDKQYKGDSREYRNLNQIIFGYVDNENLIIYCANDMQGLSELRNMTEELINTLKRPYYAFNCAFESCVWFNQIGIKIGFDGELQSYKFESKREAVRSLSISNYDDPFFDDGSKCSQAWSVNKISLALAHNRACLLKERDILLKRGCRIPETCMLIDI